MLPGDGKRRIQEKRRMQKVTMKGFYVHNHMRKEMLVSSQDLLKVYKENKCIVRRTMKVHVIIFTDFIQ